MRLRHHSGRIVHLSHGTEPRPARSLSAVVEQLDTYAAVRADRGVDTLGVSLWLPPTLAAALAIDGRSRTRLRAELDARGLEVVTLSAVSCSEGGDEGTDQPDWSSLARLEYTLDVARVLVDLLPDDAVRGVVGTIGLGRREGWGEEREKACSRILGRLSGGLAEVAWQTGRAVRVGFRPEPGAVLDGSASVAAAFARVDKDRLGVSLDLAHLACTWEDPAAYLDRLAGAGVPVIRVEAAAALEVADPRAAADTLRRYADDGPPHAVTTPDGGYVADLAQALRDFPPGPWRVLSRVPLRSEPPAPLTATTEVWRSALRHLMAGPVPGTEYLDIEWHSAIELAELGLSPPGNAISLADSRLPC
ncbi:xylose isomerase [Actinoplanes sp. NPDC051346]|uniref:sugar phosphate isomerase/epimerase family protein n=1 Tax=Actinoplanes sp. NPDC051346 TaxID=3155048 RepID=UPI00342B171C